MDLKNKYKKETSIDLKEIFWRLLEQWKAIALVALCVMALFLGYVHLHHANDSKKEEQANQTQEQVSEEEILNALPESERSLVASAYQLMQKRDQFSNYIRTAPILKIDPNHLNRLRVSWAVGGNDNAGALTMAYVAGLQEESCRKALLEASGADLNVEQFGSLMNASFPAQLDLDIVCYDIYLTEDMQAEAVQKELKDQVEAMHAELQNEFGEHQILNYQSELAVVANQDLYQTQVTALNGFVNINTQLNNLKNAFSADQERAFSKLQANTNKQEAVEKPQAAPPKTITPLNILVGLILGACAYLVAFFLYTVLSRRAISPSILQESSVRSLGEWHSTSEAKQKVLTRDAFVWKKHHKGSLDREVENAKIAHTVGSICGFRQIKELLLLLTAECSQEQKDFVLDLCDSLGTKGIGTKLIEAGKEGLSFDDSDLIDAEGVVLFVIDSKTKAQDIGYVFDRCNDYEKPIVGSVYLG